MFEGEKFYLGRLEVTGNTTTRDKVIRREFALDEGDVMNMEAVKKSLQKLQQLGYFKVNEEPEFAVRAAEKKVDLTLKGTETSRNTDPVRRGLLGPGRLLRPVLLPDPELPRPRRDRWAVGADRPGLQLLQPLVHDPLVHGPQPDGRGVHLQQERQLPEHRREAQGRDDLLRQGTPSLRQLVDPVPVRGRQGELPRARRADAAGSARSARPSSRRSWGRRRPSLRATGSTAATIPSTPTRDSATSRPCSLPEPLSAARTASSSR